MAGRPADAGPARRARPGRHMCLVWMALAVRPTPAGGTCRRRIETAVAGRLDAPARHEQHPRDARTGRGRPPCATPVQRASTGRSLRQSRLLRLTSQTHPRPNAVKPLCPASINGLPHPDPPNERIGTGQASAGPSASGQAHSRLGRAWLAGARDHRFPRIHSVTRSRQPPGRQPILRAYRSW